MRGWYVRFLVASHPTFVVCRLTDELLHKFGRAAMEIPELQPLFGQRLPRCFEFFLFGAHGSDFDTRVRKPFT